MITRKWCTTTTLEAMRSTWRSPVVSVGNNGGTGCGVNSIKVFFTWYYEDVDRDDANGPSWNAATCAGVEPGT
jgi:hypothetical protein